MCQMKLQFHEIFILLGQIDNKQIPSKCIISGNDYRKMKLDRGVYMLVSSAGSGKASLEEGFRVKIWVKQGTAW